MEFTSMLPREQHGPHYRAFIEYVDKLNRCAKEDPVRGQCILAVDPECLVAKDPLLTLVSHAGSIVAGGHAIVDTCRSRFWIGGLWTEENHSKRGLASAVIRRLIAERCFLDGGELGSVATVRQFPSGKINEGSLKAFLRNGYVPFRVRRTPLEQLGPEGRHLQQTVEDDGSIRSLVMLRYPAPQSLPLPEAG